MREEFEKIRASFQRICILGSKYMYKNDIEMVDDIAGKLNGFERRLTKLEERMEEKK